MAGPGGKSVGRVSIRVVPDSTRFKEDLKKSLERIEKSTVLNIPLGIETRKAELALKKFQKNWNGQALNFDVDTKTLGASAKLKVFTRPRTVNVFVKMSKASLAKASTILASLSGARLANDLVKNLSTKLQNLDRALPKLALVALGVASIGSAALSSVGGLVTVGAGLAKIAGLGLALPGILAGTAIAVGVLAVALSAAKTQLASLLPVWNTLKKTIRDNFWAQAQQPIISLVRGILPQLRSGVSKTATELGSWAASVTSEFQKAFGNGVLSGMFVNLNKSIRIASTGTGAFAQSIATLGTVGSAYLPRLAGWVAQISKDFNGWLTKVAASGQLTKFIDDALFAGSQLVDVFRSAISILSGINKAALAAGGGGLSTLQGVLYTVAQIVNSPAFQTTLTTLFQGASAGVSGLVSALAPIGQMLSALAPVLKTVLASSGKVIGDILGKIAGALSQPAFAKGLSGFFAGIESGLTAIAPALPALAAALGTLATFAGVLAAQLGPILGAVLAALAPILTTVLTALQPLIPILGGALLSIITALAPIFVQFVTTLLPPLAALFATLVTAAMPLVMAILPVLQALMPVIGTIILALLPIITQLAGIFAQVAAVLAPIIVQLLPPLTALFAALMPVITAVFAAVMPLITSLLSLIVPLLKLIGPILGPLIKLLTFLVTVALKPFLQVLPIISALFGGVAKAIGDVLLPVVKMITAVLDGLIKFLTGVFTGNWRRAWAGIREIFSGLWNGIAGIARGALNGLIDIIDGMIRSVNSITTKIGIPRIPTIPHLALGADVLPTVGGTLTVLGEGGRTERIVDAGLGNKNLELQNKLIQKALARAGSDSGVKVNLNVMNPVGEPTEETVRRSAQLLGVALGV